MRFRRNIGHRDGTGIGRKCTVSDYLESKFPVLVFDAMARKLRALNISRIQRVQLL